MYSVATRKEHSTFQEWYKSFFICVLQEGKLSAPMTMPNAWPVYTRWCRRQHEWSQRDDPGRSVVWSWMCESPIRKNHAFQVTFKKRVKGLSHWRRRHRDCQDWSVAATRATRETKKWLALTKETSPRLPRLISRGDSRDQHMACALTSRRRFQDLLETEKVSQKNRTCFNFPWLPGDPASLHETSRRRLRNQRRLESPSSGHLVYRPVR